MSFNKFGNYLSGNILRIQQIYKLFIYKKFHINICNTWSILLISYKESLATFQECIAYIKAHMTRVKPMSGF